MAKMKIPQEVKGYGYVTLFNNGSLGRFLPPHLGDQKTPLISEHAYAKGERFFLCEIVIRPVLKKNGKPVTKIMK